MNICSWNIRGFNHPLKHKEISSLMRTQKIGIMAILESHVYKDNFDILMQKVFPNFNWFGNYVHCNDGRILLVWDAMHFDLHVLFSSAQLVHCLVYVKALRQLVAISFVYGYNDGNNRNSLWRDLDSISLNIDKPWCCLGDFNAIISPAERVSKIPPKASDIGDFISCMSNCSLSDLPFKGSFFT